MSQTILDQFLSHGIRQGSLSIVYADGTKSTHGQPVDGLPNVVLRFADDSVPSEILRNVTLGAAEAFMEARLEFEEGDVLGLATLLRANDRWERSDSNQPPTLAKRQDAKADAASDEVNDAERSKDNVAHHYDIGNDLYALMLDEEHWQYSCAYWPRDDMTLGEAQTAKLAHIAAKLAIEPGDTVLDIGCGWGGMAIFLAKNYDVHVTGITLSEEQAAFARERVDAAGLAEKVSIVLHDYRDLAMTGRRYDRIVSVGMFEHVGRPQFETFFSACAALLSKDGAMLIHTIGRLGAPGITDDFTRKYIFPGGYIPALSETVEASEKFHLIATDIETLRMHYGKTLRCWYANCVANREAIVAMFDERFYRMWTYYLAGAATVFEYGGMCNYQIQYARDRHALPITRDYIEAEEKRLLGR